MNPGKKAFWYRGLNITFTVVLQIMLAKMDYLMLVLWLNDTLRVKEPRERIRAGAGDMKTLERNKILVVCLIIGFLFDSCFFKKVPYEEADARLSQCVQNWRFFELTDTVVVTVVLFKKNLPQTAKMNPAFIVGYTKSGDTIGAIDKRFELELERGEKVKLTVSVWPIDKVENMHNYPLYRVYQKDEEITAICNVQKVFNSTFNAIK